MISLYIHIPFCASKCYYCDFFSVASRSKIDNFVDALCREIALRGAGGDRQKVSTIYFGGGTPSTLTVEQMSRIVAALRDAFHCCMVEEMTLEANPEQLTDTYLASLRELGFDRLSVGIQSFVDDHLAIMGRRHTARQAIEAIATAQKNGFDNISIDLIYGLPFMSVEQWRANVEAAVELGVQHISAYHLTVEPRTVFAARGMATVDECVSEQHYNILRERLATAGFIHYEISNFALPHRHSRHNSGYWNSTPYLGFGPSAHSYDGVRTRRWNMSDLGRYCALGDYFESETLSHDDLHNEYVMTRLRTAAGFSIADYEARFARLLPRSVCGLVVDGDRAHIEPQQWLISDAIIASLFI